MANIKHVGRIVATGKKCLVAYRTLPGDAYNCLIVPTENLPDSYHDSLINLVESNAGQEAYEFAEAMARMTFPDGSTILPALHTQGRLVKVPTDAVEMLPNSNASILLSELNQIIAEQRGIAVDGLSIKPEVPEKPKTEVVEIATAQEVPTTPLTEAVRASTDSLTFNTPEEEAKFYRSQADKLAKQAAEMRRKAEELAPTKKKAKETA